jgi:DNA helicase-2/ATP-dependent DNA helicase PcrA
MSNLTEEQLRAIKAPSGPVVLLAGAGSGKTTVLSRRYFHLLSQDILPHAILAVTFTTDAACELKARIVSMAADSALPQKTIEALERTPYIGTLHSLCYRWLNEYGSLLGLQPISRILSVLEWLAFFEKRYALWLEDLSPGLMEKLFSLFGYRELAFVVSRCCSHEIDASAPMEGMEKTAWETLWSATEPLATAIRKELAACGLYSFEDLEKYTAQILEYSSATCQRLRDQFRFILVDEFQDTSPRQWSILTRIAGNETHKYYLVGDPKQSIYRFRHADTTLFTQAISLCDSQGGHALSLSINFRSSEPLLVTLNHAGRTLFANREPNYIDMKAAALFQCAKVEMITHDEALPVRVARYPTEKTRAETEKHESALLINELTHLTSKKVRQDQIAILFRNNDRIRPVRDLLRHHGFTVGAKHTRSLFLSYSTTGLVFFLKSLLDPLDDFALSGFLRSPYVGISMRDLWTLHRREGDSLFEKLVAAPPPATGSGR